MAVKYTTITSAGESTDWMTLNYGQRFSISIWGTWSGELRVERRLNGVNPMAVESFTQNVEKDGIAAAPQEIRVYCVSMSSGAANVGRFTQALKAEGTA